MSAETRAVLEAAIEAHVAAEGEAPGSVLTGYALIVSHATGDDFADNVTRYLTEVSEGQPFHVTLGLVHRHRLVLESGE